MTITVLKPAKTIPTLAPQTCDACGKPIRLDVHFDPAGRVYCSATCVRRGPAVKGQ